MAVVVKEGNVFDSDADIICHQVNCQGVMGSGVAKEIRERYPYVFKEYKMACNIAKDYPAKLLGEAQILGVDENDKTRWIVNCFGQEKYGYDGAQYTSVGALMEAFQKVATFAEGSNMIIAMPYKIGCCRGGADWDTVKKIIEVTFKDCNVELWKLEGK